MARAGTIAVVFDFDDTLTPDSTSALLKRAKPTINPARFWEKDVDELVKQGWEPVMAYIHLLFKLMDGGRLKRYTNKDLRDFGKKLKPYPGLKGLFKDLRKIASAESCDIEFYIISGGLQDIVEGFRLRSEFRAVWGCQLAPERRGGPVKYVRRAISFTEKTRYLFEINKGIVIEAAKNPFLVNKDVPPAERPIPFSNMIYIGDGISDIPCFSVVQKRQGDSGKAIGVWHPGQEKSCRRAWIELIAPKRVVSAHAPRYGPKNEMGSLLRTVVATMAAELKVQKALAEKSPTH